MIARESRIVMRARAALDVTQQDTLRRAVRAAVSDIHLCA